MFIDGPAGRLFAVYHAATPRSGREAGRAVLYLPAFAEEMNRSRRMAALQARALAARGVAVLLLDPYGTGDSAGDFADARWGLWGDDAAAALAWLRAQGHSRLALLGLRLGACLALDVAMANDVDRVVLWQPVARGDVFLNQFLRIRVTAGLSRAGEAKETTKALREGLTAGQVMEVAGYPLAPPLAAAIDRIRLADLEAPRALPVDWLEIGGGPTGSLSPASQTVIERWRAAGIDVTVGTMGGEPFWAIEETTLVPELLTATAERLAGSGP
jgi:exosortase A-associated hydrolase 2